MIEQPRWRQSQRRRKATKGKRGKTRGARGQTGTYFPRVQGSPCPLSAAPPDTLPLSSPLLLFPSLRAYPTARIFSLLSSLPFLFFIYFFFFFLHSRLGGVRNPPRCFSKRFGSRTAKRGLHNYSGRASPVFLGQWDCGSMGQWTGVPIEATPRDPDSHITVLETSSAVRMNPGCGRGKKVERLVGEGEGGRERRRGGGGGGGERKEENDR